MISDKERREVALRLREMGEKLGSSVLLWYHIAKILGVRTATDGKTACDMLADLVEPGCDRDTPQKAAEEMFGKMRHSTKEEADAYDAMLKSKSVGIHPVDRDALLKVADMLECDGECSECECGKGTFCEAPIIAAARIRKALREES